MSLIEARGLTKTYRSGDVEVPAVRGVDFAIEAGLLAAFVGPSGSGKSTVLNMIGCLDRPSSGCLRVLDGSPDPYPTSTPGGVVTREQLRAIGLAEPSAIAPDIDVEHIDVRVRLRDQYGLDSMGALNLLAALH
jgi:ABC-type dipeptide/oligopeptide/nickel transport system ATPase subunit